MPSQHGNLNGSKALILRIRKAIRPKPRHQTLGAILKFDPNTGRALRLLV